MRIRGFWAVSSLLILSTVYGRAAATPTIKIKLAPEIRSEDVIINYYLYGAFGAAGATASPAANTDSYYINPVHDGKVATSIKAVIYASGCEFDTLEADILEDTAIEKSYECVPLATVSLVGHIPRRHGFHDRDFEVVIRYLGEWQCRFFELLDCEIPQMELARVPVNENGEFEATIVDFSPEQKLRPHHKAELWVILRDAKTWNPIGQGLRPPREMQTWSGNLAIKSFYPPPVEFEVVLAPQQVPAPPNARP